MNALISRLPKVNEQTVRCLSPVENLPKVIKIRPEKLTSLGELLGPKVSLATSTAEKLWDKVIHGKALTPEKMGIDRVNETITVQTFLQAVRTNPEAIKLQLRQDDGDSLNPATCFLWRVGERSEILTFDPLSALFYTNSPESRKAIWKELFGGNLPENPKEIGQGLAGIMQQYYPGKPDDVFHYSDKARIDLFKAAVVAFSLSDEEAFDLARTLFVDTFFVGEAVAALIHLKTIAADEYNPVVAYIAKFCPNAVPWDKAYWADFLFGASNIWGTNKELISRTLRGFVCSRAEEALEVGTVAQIIRKYHNNIKNGPAFLIDYTIKSRPIPDFYPRESESWWYDCRIAKQAQLHFVFQVVKELFPKNPIDQREYLSACVKEMQPPSDPIHFLWLSKKLPPTDAFLLLLHAAGVSWDDITDKYIKELFVQAEERDFQASLPDKRVSQPLPILSRQSLFTLHDYVIKVVADFFNASNDSGKGNPYDQPLFIEEGRAWNKREQLKAQMACHYFELFNQKIPS